MTFNQRVSEIQEKYEKTQELLDSKNQKYKDIKSSLKRIQEDGLDKDQGYARLQEEVDLNAKLRAEAETRSKKFEGKFRQALKEIDDLRDQLEEQKSQAVVGA